MKKLFAILISAIFIFSFSACSGSDNNSDKENTTTTVAETKPETDELSWVDYKEYNLDKTSEVNNIILMIGDGMGENIIKAAEVVKGDKLVMSGLKNKTYVTTYSQSVTEGLEEFTDSAASATAISTGTKTYNGCIGVDKDGNNLETICEYAQKCGMKTGLVDRHYVCHATPAGMVAHNDFRGSYKAILNEMIRSEVDVMLGGGSQYYTPSVQENAESYNYTYITDEKGLLSLSDKDEKVLGLFAYDNMKDPELEPSLTTQTSKALELLENDNGFFLMVEGSNIDVCESEQDMDGTIKQMQAFDQTVDYVMNWAQEHPGTLVIVTADHETGGVTLPKNPTPEDINNDCFTSGGDHTNTNVLLFADGAQSAGICKEKLIDNTDIAKYMRKVLAYKK
ncbi:MAG: alkaline phosphatase [Ruminococcus sp.]